MSIRNFFKIRRVRQVNYAFAVAASFQPSPCGWYVPESLAYRKKQSKKIKNYLLQLLD